MHLEQTVGIPNSEDTPDVALIRMIIAGHAPVPVELEYTGPLPSPIVAGNVVISPDHSIPFWAQITPPTEGDLGAGLILLVRYTPDTSFDVTAQLLTKARTSTPTAILTCNAQSDHDTCRAASMISDSRGRHETSLTGIPNQPHVADLEKYGFFPPAEIPVPDPDTAQTAEPDIKATPPEPTPTPAKNTVDVPVTKSSKPSATKQPSRPPKGKSTAKTPLDGDTDSSKGGK